MLLLAKTLLTIAGRALKTAEVMLKGALKLVCIQTIRNIGHRFEPDVD